MIQQILSNGKSYECPKCDELLNGTEKGYSVYTCYPPDGCGYQIDLWWPEGIILKVVNSKRCCNCRSKYKSDNEHQCKSENIKKALEQDILSCEKKIWGYEEDVKILNGFIDGYKKEISELNG